jgi:hypothetical protein
MNEYSKENITYSLLKDKTVKIISIVNKFNTTINFVNLHDFLKNVSYLETKVVFFFLKTTKNILIKSKHKECLHNKDQK